MRAPAQDESIVQVRKCLRLTNGRANSFTALQTRFLQLLTLALIWLVLPADASDTTQSPQLFVLTTDSNSVAVIDSATDQITTRIPVGVHPVRLAMTPDRLKAYVSNGLAGTVSVIDTVNRIVTATIPTQHAGPQEITVTPDGGRVFVVHQGAGDVAVIDTATDTLIRNVTIDGTLAKDVLATPDGRFVYVANYSANEVSVIDTATYLVNNIATPAGPRRLAITPSGDRIFATAYLGDSVSVIDTLTQTVIKNVPVGRKPRGIAITPDGREIYVTNVRGATVSVIDNAQLNVVATIGVGNTPWHLAITPDGAWAYVSNARSQSVSIIDTGTHALVKTLAVGQGPFFSVVDPSATKLYVSNAMDTTVSVIDLASQAVLQTIQQVGSQPFDLLFDGPQGLPPTPPSDLTASAVLAGQGARVDLSWKDNSSNETGFEVGRCSGLGCSNFQVLATAAANVVKLRDKSVTRARSYSYRVRATSNSGPSDYSNVATVTTP